MIGEHVTPSTLVVPESRTYPGTTCTVEFLVTNVAKHLGEQDSKIILIGTRHGEKLHETHLSRAEILKATDLSLVAVGKDDPVDASQTCTRPRVVLIQNLDVGNGAIGHADASVAGNVPATKTVSRVPTR